MRTLRLGAIPFTAVLLSIAIAMAARAETLPDDTRRFARGSNAFGFDLYGRLRAIPGNLAFSPASVTLGLGMAWSGARGATADEMRRVLRHEGNAETVNASARRLSAELRDPSQDVVLRIANRLFGDRTLAVEKGFLDATNAAYGAGLEALDFRRTPEAARDRINGWVEEQTERKIRELVPLRGVTRDTRLALVNAVYFQGDWDEAFPKESTRPEPFSASATRRPEVPTMHRTGTLRFAARDGLEALELPYKGSRLSMLVLLPDRGEGLAALETTLGVDRVEAIVASLAPTRVAVSLPSFEVNPPGSIALGENLNAMGMALAFDRAKADFTGIANPQDPRDRLFLGNVFHKAFVKVDEKGTEAAAATAVVIPRAPAALSPKAVEFKADHPFLFVIRHNPTGLIVFLGRVANPAEK